MQKPSLLRRLASTVFLLLLVALLMFGAAVLRTVQRLLNEGVRQHAETSLLLIKPSITDLLRSGDSDGIRHFCERVGTLSRMTVLLPEGTVLGDSMADPDLLDNHLGRPEIRQAHTEGIGYHRRYSYSLHEFFAYLAHRVDADDGACLGFVRVAVPTSVYDQARKESVLRLLAALLLLLPLTAAATWGLMRHLARPLAEMRHSAERFAAGDFSVPVQTSHSREVDALADCLTLMAGQLDSRLREITRQRNETDAILRGMSEGVVATDGQFRILRMNQAAAGLFGVDPEQVRGLRLIEVVRNAALLDTLEQALANDIPAEAETTMVSDAGESTLSIRASRLADSAGAVAVLHDTTRIRRLEKMRRDFVANVSHELRTPITVIQGFVETLAEGAFNDPHMAPRFLSTIQRSSERLGRIVDDLLLLSRLDNHPFGGSRAPDREQAQLGPLVRAAVQAAEQTHGERRSRIRIEGDESAVLDLYPGFFQTAVANLVENALKYSPPEADVCVGLSRTPVEVRISVADQGPGIPIKHQTRIFERFYRVDKGRSRELGGTGLGLAIVKHVMNVHGGSVELVSREGAGSTFTLVFPQGA